MDNSVRKLGQRIQELRKESGRSQEEFAKLIKRTPAHLSKIERGEKSPSLELLFSIADHLQIPLKTLFDKVGGSDASRTVKEQFDALLNVTTPKKAKLMFDLAKKIHSSDG